MIYKLSSFNERPTTLVGTSLGALDKAKDLEHALCDDHEPHDVEKRDHDCEPKQNLRIWGNGANSGEMGGSEGMVSRQRGKEGWVQGGGGEEVGVNKFNGASNHDQRQQQQRRIEI